MRFFSLFGVSMLCLTGSPLPLSAMQWYRALPRFSSHYVTTINSVAIGVVSTLLFFTWKKLMHFKKIVVTKSEIPALITQKLQDPKTGVVTHDYLEKNIKPLLITSTVSQARGNLAQSFATAGEVSTLTEMFNELQGEVVKLKEENAAYKARIETLEQKITVSGKGEVTK